MRLHFAHHYGFHRLFVIADIFAAVATIVASFALAVVRYGASVTRHSLQGLGIAAYRVVGSLRPVYRESYDSHGLSLADGRMRP
ncbi:hypothetical protein [Ensifer sp. 1H6]|uniref:hypothetical protein n=1 Tax=Ensifer sp. 1H6 TaxID=1911585 RepID=UPI0009CB2E4B|nr:hypothetical protein [Ensifer sp. 1H6]OMQ41680.1 hypothetical protein BKP54_27640 [Ensifer sp. 1H6]